MQEERAITAASVSHLAYFEVVEPSRGLVEAGPRPSLHLARADVDNERSADVISHLVHRAALTSRDVEVLGLLAQGWTTAEIAHQLVYAESTIKKEVHLIVHRLGAKNRTQAVAMAIRASVI